MSNIKSTSNLEFQITLTLTETEARALKALTGYGEKQFLECFYKGLGRHYLEPYSSGIKSLFSTIDIHLPRHLHKIKETKNLWDK